MSHELETIREWVHALPADVEVVKAVLDTEAVPTEARKLAAGALNYLVTRLDLIPDWNPDIGLIDDVLVLRVCMEMAAAHGVIAALPDSARREVARLANQVDTVRTLLGPDLTESLRRHCRRLVDQVVHGRSASALVRDAATRTALYGDVAADLERRSDITATDLDEVERRLRSYLHHKLSGA
ncbi:YkvA family protein [Haliangium sp.]|uniref:YkvA family protein n=1 Tax=Haliangium sp. TaxID=2663208 RepID=UPI003D0FD687